MSKKIKVLLLIFIMVAIGWIYTAKLGKNTKPLRLSLPRPQEDNIRTHKQMHEIVNDELSDLSSDIVGNNIHAPETDSMHYNVNDGVTDSNLGRSENHRDDKTEGSNDTLLQSTPIGGEPLLKESFIDETTIKASKKEKKRPFISTILTEEHTPERATKQETANISTDIQLFEGTNDKALNYLAGTHESKRVNVTPNDTFAIQVTPQNTDKSDKVKPVDGNLINNMTISSDKANSIVKTSVASSLELRGDRRNVSIYHKDINRIETDVVHHKDSSIAHDERELTLGKGDIVDLIETEDGQYSFDYGDPEFSLERQAQVIQESETLFRTFPNYQNSTKMLVYKCEQNCGGFGDRIKGIVEIYMLSILCKRRFALIMTEPSDLENYFEANMLDWRLTEAEINTEAHQKLVKEVADYKTLHHVIAVEYELMDYDPATAFKGDVTHIIANQDWTRTLRKLSVTSRLFSELYRYPSSDLLRTIFYGLFRPSRRLQEQVDTFFGNIDGHKLACLHARMGEKGHVRLTFSQIIKALTFIKNKFSSSEYKTMIATDNLTVDEFASKFFSNLVNTSYIGAIFHVDNDVSKTNDTREKDEGFLRALVDHTILTRCDALVLTNSGFGVSAAALRHTSCDLYVFENDEVIPARREFLREMFQWRCPTESGRMYICDG